LTPKQNLHNIVLAIGGLNGGVSALAPKVPTIANKQLLD